MEENNNVETTQVVEQSTKKKGTGFIIVLLILIILGMAGYIYYDKFYKNANGNIEVKELEKKKEETQEEKHDLDDEVVVSQESILKLAKENAEYSKYINTNFDKYIRITEANSRFELSDASFTIENDQLVLTQKGNKSIVSNIDEKVVQLIDSPFNCDDVHSQYILTNAGNLYNISIFDESTRELIPGLKDKVLNNQEITIRSTKVNTDDIKVLALLKTNIYADSEGRNYTCGAADAIAYTSDKKYRSIDDFNKVYEKLLISATVDAETGITTFTYVDGTTETINR